MKYIKLIFRGLLVILFLIVVLAILLPIIFKDDIVEGVKKEINENVNAKVEFEDASLSLFNDFPNISLSLDQLAITGLDKFEGVKLISADKISAHMDFFSLIRKGDPVKINSIDVDKADINIVNLTETEANYLIAKETDTVEGETSEFLIELESYSLSDSRLRYEDRVADMVVLAEGVNHEGSGDFTSTIFDLDTETKIESFNVNMDGIAYLSKAKADLDAKINIDNEKSLYTLKENVLKLNQLELLANGAIQIEGDDIKIKADLLAEKNQFKDFLSIIPSAFTKDFEQVKADGSTDLSVNIKGTYNSLKESYPLINMKLDIDNGYVKYPDLPKDISNLNIDLSLKTLDKNLSQMSLNIPAFSLQIGNNPIAGFFKSSGSIDNPKFEAYVKGTLDLDELKSAFPIEAIDNMAGIIDLDASMDASLSDINNNNFERIKFSGQGKLTNLLIDAKEYPAINIKASEINFSPKAATVSTTPMTFGKSDATFEAQLSNPLAYFLTDKSMSGTMKMRSNYIDANEWIVETEETSAAEPIIATDEELESVINNASMDYDLAINQLDYETYQLKDLKSKGSVKANKIKLQSFETKMDDSDIKVNGELVNAYDWINDKAVLEGDIKFESDLLDLNPFLVEEGSAGDAGEENYVNPSIPDNVDINLRANAGLVKYTNIDLKNVVGDIKVKDNTAFLSGAKADMLGGELDLEGFYAAPPGDKSSFSLKSNVSKFQFQEAFDKFITIQKLAPIAQYINGFFNSTMIISGDLTDDLLPDLGTISASGFIETLNGVVNGLAPLNKISNKLSLDNLSKNITLDNTRNWFEIKDGIVEIKPFEYSYKDIDMKIAGTHAYDQDMNYVIDAAIPRELLKGNSLGAIADKGLSFLETEAGKLGLNIDQGDYINLHINMGGNIKDPTVKIKPVSSGGVSTKEVIKDEIKNQIEEVKEETKVKIETKKNEVVDSVKTVVNTAKDSIKTVIETKKNEVVDSVKTVIKEQISDKIDSTVKDIITQETAEKILGKDLEKEKDKIKDKLGGFNPFKKKN